MTRKNFPELVAPALPVSKQNRSASSRGSQRAPHAHFSNVFLGLFVLALAFAPAWDAAVPALPRVLCGMAFAAIGLAMAVRHIGWRDGFSGPPAGIYIPLLCAGAVALWALMQAFLPVPSGIGDPVWGMAAETLQIALPVHISVAPVDTVFAVSTFTTMVLVFMIAVKLGGDPQKAEAGVLAIVWIGGLYAFSAVLAQFFSWDLVLLGPNNIFDLARQNGFTSATFRNQDHFADLCVIALAAAGPLAWRDARRLRDKIQINAGTFVDVVPLIAGLILMLILATALWLTRSRAGMTTGIVAELVFAALVGARLRRSARPGQFYAVVIGASVFAITIVIVGLESAAGTARFGALGPAATARGTLYQSVGEAIWQHPVFGTGFGAFQDAFAVYHTSDLGYGANWNAAHNIYLEAAFGLGLPMAIVLCVGAGYVVWRNLKGALTRRRYVTAPMAAAVAALAVLAHGLVDFGLQIPAVAFIFAALMGFGFAQSASSQQ